MTDTPQPQQNQPQPAQNTQQPAPHQPLPPQQQYAPYPPAPAQPYYPQPQYMPQPWQYPQSNPASDALSKFKHETTFSTASGNNTLPYVVMQVTLKEKLVGSGSTNLTQLEGVINQQVQLGYRLHTMSTSTSYSQGFLGGDRIQATLVFERMDLARSF